MEEDLEASHGVDLLAQALGRQPGASDLDDFVDFEVFFDGTAAAAEAGEAIPFLRAKLCEVFEVLLPELDQYLWHRDRFVLEPSLEGSLEEEAHLSGHLRIGDGTEDEWFVVHLLRRLTAARSDVACRVLDTDGELLLIEAALAAPRWLTPANAENRCWLRGGLVHLLPRPQAGEPQQLQRRQALAKLRSAQGESTVARGRVQRAIDARLEGYPKRALELSRHVARAVLPAKVARLLLAYPQLIAVILDHLPTPPSQELLRFRRDLPDEESSLHLDCESLGAEEDTVCIGVRFTRLQYARLASLRCSLPQRFSRKRWRLPKGAKEGSVSEKAMQLGAMLCAGLEAAYLQGPRSATAVLRWPRPGLEASCAVPRELHWWPDVAFQRRASQLQSPVDSRSLAARRAFAQQADLDEPFRKAFLRAFKDDALAKAIDFSTHWRDLDDAEAWLQVSQEDLDREMKVRQAEFDEFDRKRGAPRAGKETMPKAAASGSPSPDELEKEIAAMGSKISSLLQGNSSLEGVDPVNGPKASGAATATTAGPASAADSDSESDSAGSAGELDVLGMEDPDEGFGEDSEEEPGEEGAAGSQRRVEAEGEGMKDYLKELDEQLEMVLDGDLPEEHVGPSTPAAAAAASGKLPLSSRHVKVHASDSLELDMHAMEHVLASFCSEHQLEPGPASLLLGELGLARGAAGYAASATLDAMD
eukprot:TRINITY_DN3950_c0_g1_i1.p1 TRINITY_DN3950_c0_g1~~TRINITY_DN3950_c0_g1_i1.p1  ORF type:complete len:717 (+),score=181.91 TRINITY_DN3950_c0_g1_i1:44-2152(+)